MHPPMTNFADNTGSMAVLIQCPFSVAFLHWDFSTCTGLLYMLQAGPRRVKFPSNLFDQTLSRGFGHGSVGLYETTILDPGY